MPDRVQSSDYAGTFSALPDRAIVEKWQNCHIPVIIHCVLSDKGMSGKFFNKSR
jgi:hypothetical protein